MKTITATELKALIHSQLANSDKKTSIMVKDFVVTTQFVSNFNEIRKDYQKLHFSNCVFKGGFCLKLQHGTPRFLTIDNCIFEKTLTIDLRDFDNKKSVKGVTIKKVVVKKTMEISARRFRWLSLSDISAPVLRVESYGLEDAEPQEITFGKLYFKSFENDFKYDKGKMIVRSCPRSMLDIVKNSFPDIPVKIITDDIQLPTKFPVKISKETTLP